MEIMYAAYAVAYLILGGVALRVFDKWIGAKASMESAIWVVLGWPALVLACAVYCVLKVIVPDIDDRDIGRHHFPPPPFPPRRCK